MADRVLRIVIRAENEADKVFADVSRSLNRLGLDFDIVNQRARAGSEGFTRFQANLVTLNQALELARRAFNALKRPFEELADRAERFIKLSAQFGIPVPELSKLDYAARQAGVSLEGILRSGRILGAQMIQAANGTKEAQAAFTRLGLSQKDLNAVSKQGLIPTLDLIGQRLAKVPNQVERAGLATKLFGRSAGEVSAVLEESGGSMEALGDRAERLGIVMTEKLAHQFKEVKDRGIDVKDSFLGLFTTILQQTGTLESVSGGLKGIADALVALRKNEELQAIFRDMASGSKDAAKSLVDVVEQVGRLVAAFLQLKSGLEPLELLNLGVQGLAATVTAAAISVDTLSLAWAHWTNNEENARAAAGRLHDDTTRLNDVVLRAQQGVQRLTGEYKGFVGPLEEVKAKASPVATGIEGIGKKSDQAARQLASLRAQTKGLAEELELQLVHLDALQRLPIGTTPEQLRAVTQEQERGLAIAKNRAEAEKAIAIAQQQFGVAGSRAIVEQIKHEEDLKDALYDVTHALADAKQAQEFFAQTTADGTLELEHLTGQLSDRTYELAKAKEAASKAHITDPEQLRQLDELTGKLFDARKAAQGYTSIFDTAAGVGSDFFDSVILGGRKFSEFAKTIPASIGKMFEEGFIKGLKAKTDFDEKFQVNIFDLMKNAGQVLTGQRGIGQLFEGAFKGAGVATEAGVGKAADALQVLPSAAEKAAELSSESLHGIGTASEVAAQQSTNAFGSFFSWLVNAGQSAFGALANIATSVVGTILKALSSIFGGGGTGIGGALGTAANWVTGLMGGGTVGTEATGGGAGGTASTATSGAGFFANLFGRGGALSASQQVTEFGFAAVAKELGYLRAVLGQFTRFLPIIGGLLGVAFGGNPLLRAGSGLAAVGGLTGIFPSAFPAATGALGTLANVPILGSVVQGIANIVHLVSLTYAAITGAAAPAAAPAISGGAAGGAIGGGLAGGVAAGGIAAAVVGAIINSLQFSKLLNAQGKIAPEAINNVGNRIAIAGDFPIAGSIQLAIKGNWRAAILEAVLGPLGTSIEAAGIDILGLMGPPIREVMKKAFADQLATVLGRSVSTAGGILPRGLRGQGLGPGLDIIAGASLVGFGREGLSRPDLAGAFRQMIAGSLRGPDLERAQRDIRSIVTGFFGSLVGMFREWNVFVEETGRVGKRTAAGVRTLGNLFPVAGVNVGDIAAGHVRDDQSVAIKAMLQDVRSAVLKAAEGGAELTARDARRYGDPFLLIVAKLQKDVPKAIDLFGTALAVATDGIEKNAEQLSRAIQIQTAIFARGLPQLSPEELAAVGSPGGGQRGLRTAQARAGALATLNQFRGQGTLEALGFGQLSAGMQANRQIEAATYNLGKVFDSLEKREVRLQQAIQAGDTQQAQKTRGKIKEDQAQIEQITQQAIDAAKQWGSAVLSIIDQLRTLQTTMEDFNLSTGETIDSLTGAADTAARYSNVIDLTTARLDKAASAGAKLDIINRIMDLLQKQAQAAIQDVQDAADAQKKPLQERLDAIAEELDTVQALASLLDGVRAQMAALRIDAAGGGVSSLRQTQVEIARQLQTFRGGGTPEERAAAAQQVASLAGTAVEIARQTFGPASQEFRTVQQEQLGNLSEIEQVAKAAADKQASLLEEQKNLQQQIKDIDTQAAKDVETIKETLAAQLLFWQTQAAPLFGRQAQELRSQLAELFPGQDIEALLADPQRAQLAVQQAQLKKLEEIRLTLLGEAPETTPTTERVPLPPGPSVYRPPVGSNGITVPFFGEGGIVRRPTLAVVGDRGPEIIEPLNRRQERSAPINVTVVMQPAKGEPLARAQLWGRTAASAIEAELQRSNAFGAGGRTTRRKVG